MPLIITGIRIKSILIIDIHNDVIGDLIEHGLRYVDKLMVLH